MSSPDLQPSKLGTKEHWDNVYSSELANFEEIGDEGEVWFGEDSVEKMVGWTLENIPSDPPPFILEIGAGNGNLLFALCEEGYMPHHMCGIDYSADAVQLARTIARYKATPRVDEDAYDEEPKPPLKNADKVVFATCDFLQQDVPPLDGMPSTSEAVWDLVLDKGTFDAIALAEKHANGRTPADEYPARIARAVKPGGYFLITSCNFTEDELRTKFANIDTGLVYHSRVPWPTFSFGGKSGNVYSTVAFYRP